MEDFPGFVVERAFHFPPLPRSAQYGDEAPQLPFDLLATVLHLPSIEKIQSILELDDSSVVDCRLAHSY